MRSYAALLSLSEIGLGSLLHSLHAPFAGHILSLLQGFILARAVRTTDVGNRRILPATISNIAALLKSFSPAGKRLTPMLAISAQGLLFSVGTLLLGPNFFGCLLGISLLAVWSFIQPALIYYLIFGNALVEALGVMFKELNRYFSIEPAHLGWALGALVTVKLALGVWLCLFAYFGDEATQEAWLAKLEKHARSLKGERGKRPLKAFFNPLFLFSLALTLVVFAISESPSAKLIWLLLRPLAVGAVIYLLFPLLPLEKIAQRLEWGRFPRLGRELAHALSYLKQSKHPGPREAGRQR